jgi:hypothetical protein
VREKVRKIGESLPLALEEDGHYHNYMSRELSDHSGTLKERGHYSVIKILKRHMKVLKF